MSFRIGGYSAEGSGRRLTLPMTVAVCAGAGTTASARVTAARAAGPRALTAPEAEKIMDAYGIPTPKEGLARTADEAAKIAGRLKFPVVMKIVSDDILHKTEAGGVVVGVASGAEAKRAFSTIVKNAKAYKKGANIIGVQVQQMLGGGQEVIVGAITDPSFGKLVAFGLGGVLDSLAMILLTIPIVFPVIKALGYDPVWFGVVIVMAAAMFGAALAAFTFSHWVALSMFLLLFAGFGMMQQMASSNTILQTVVEEDKRGRVMSFYAMAFMGAAPVGSLVAGLAAKYFGAPLTLAVGGAMCLAGSVWFASRLPTIRVLVRPIYIRLGILPEVASGLQAATALQIPPEE